jgi:hypothetical protein
VEVGKWRSSMWRRTFVTINLKQTGQFPPWVGIPAEGRREKENMVTIR